MLRDSIDYKGTAVGKLFRRFLFPTVMGMVFSAVFVITDGIFVGRGIGSDALAAVNLTAPLFTLGTGLGLMFGMGGSVVASVNLAQGKRRVAQINITQSLFVPALLIVLLSALLILCHKPLLLLLGTPPELMVPAREYLVWFTLFLTPLAVFNILMLSCGSTAHHGSPWRATSWRPRSTSCSTIFSSSNSGGGSRARPSQRESAT